MNALPALTTSPYTRVVSNVLFPLHERLKRHDSVAVRKKLEVSQWWEPSQLRDFQITRLRELLAHATAHVPYYRDLFRELGFNASSIRSLSDLEQLPFLTKRIIRSNLERLKSDQARDPARSTTGGSTGEPLIFFLGRERISHDIAAKWRATRWWDVDIGDPEIVVWGSPIELGAQDRVRTVRDWLLRTELLPAFEMSDAKVARFIERIRRRQPRMLFGYPSALSHVASYSENHSIRMDDLGIRVAFVTSERLYDDQRARIARVFGCRVANGYGGREAGFVAHECPSGGMHITAEDVIVDIIGADGKTLPPGQSGEIVVTHLATRDFPFVRYCTGDMAIMGNARCQCGRGLPILEEIQGRATDFVVAQDGTVMHGLALIYVVRDLPGVSSFQVVQESIDLCRVLIVPEGQLDDNVRIKLETGFKQRLGASVQIQIELVQDIPPQSSGKFRYVVSHVPRTTQVHFKALGRNRDREQS